MYRQSRMELLAQLTTDNRQLTTDDTPVEKRVMLDYIALMGQEVPIELRAA